MEVHPILGRYEALTEEQVRALRAGVVLMGEDGAAIDLPRLPTTIEACGTVVALRRALSEDEREQLRRAPGSVPTSLSKEDRERLLADAVAGDKFVKLEVEAITFIQRSTPNRNFSRFAAGALQRMAPSFAGMPVLRDHEQRDTQARGGTIRESKLEEHAGEDGAKQIRMTLELSAPWAVEQALRGLMDRFSIGWHPTGPTKCSICDAEMIWWWCGNEKNRHWIGDAYDGQACEVVYTSAEGIEVSSVSVPAVLGTGVDDIRAQLSAARAAGPAGLGRKELPMSKSIPAVLLAALSLGADADEGAVVAEIQSRDTLFKAEKERADRLQGELDVLKAEGQKRRKGDLLERAKREGKIIPGSELEATISALADTHIDVAEKCVKDLPRLSPVGAPPQAAGADPTPVKKDGEVTAATLTPAQLKLAKQMGVTPEAYAETLNKHRSGR